MKKNRFYQGVEKRETFCYLSCTGESKKEFFKRVINKHTVIWNEYYIEWDFAIFGEQLF